MGLHLGDKVCALRQEPRRIDRRLAFEVEHEQALFWVRLDIDQRIELARLRTQGLAMACDCRAIHRDTLHESQHDPLKGNVKTRRGEHERRHAVVGLAAAFHDGGDVKAEYNEQHDSGDQKLAPPSGAVCLRPADHLVGRVVKQRASKRQRDIIEAGVRGVDRCLAPGTAPSLEGESAEQGRAYDQIHQIVCYKCGHGFVPRGFAACNTPYFWDGTMEQTRRHCARTRTSDWRVR